MRNTNCSIYKIAQTLIVDSEAWMLAQQFPFAVSHDETNTVFATTVDSPIGAYFLPLVDESGRLLSLDQQALLAASWLFSHSERGMILTKDQGISLFTHPAHRLWCAKYEDDQREQFEADYNYVGAFITAIGSAVTWPTLTPELTPAEAQQYMLLGLSQINPRR